MNTQEQKITPNIDENCPPQYLYKYCSFNKYTERTIVHSEIYFAKPLEFNDPFDSKPAISFHGLNKLENLENFLNSKEQKANELGLPWDKEGIRKELEKMIETNDYRRLEELFPYSHLDKMGIFCMAEKKDNILMWSHYSNAYRGLCLEFDATTEYFLCAFSVKYKKQRPSINFVNKPCPKQLADDLLIKPKLWDYEEEWRIIDYKKGSGVKTFPPQLLTGVIMGFRIEKRDKADLIKWCLERENKPKLNEARPNKKEFKVDIVEVSYPN